MGERCKHCKRSEWDPGEVWHAWLMVHDAHGPSLDTLVFLPPGDEPESHADWMRAPWLDSRLPAVEGKGDG